MQPLGTTTGLDNPFDFLIAVAKAGGALRLQEYNFNIIRILLRILPVSAGEYGNPRLFFTISPAWRHFSVNIPSPSATRPEVTPRCCTAEAKPSTAPGHTLSLVATNQPRDSWTADTKHQRTPENDRDSILAAVQPVRKSFPKKALNFMPPDAR